MMNVLTDILCDSSSLMASHSKLISPNEISSKHTSLQLIGSVPQLSTVERPLSSADSSSPSNLHLFNPSSTQIHIPASLETGFEDQSDVIGFSDAFPEIVPSWLTHDFMKASENLPSPGMLSNVNEIYQPPNEAEHLELLDLRFPSDLTNQNISNGLNRVGITDAHKLQTSLRNLSQDQYSNDSLMLSTFDMINASHLSSPINKNMQYQNFKHNGQNNVHNSLLQSVLPYENNLLHLPLPSGLSEQCLTTTSSPPITQSLPVVSSCDKLPQINLNHLDSLLRGESELSAEIQLLRQDFSGIQLPNVTYHQPITHCIPPPVLCEETGSFLNSTLVANTQDASVQVPDANSINPPCFSCSKVNPDAAIEIIQCFKCRFCDFVNIHKCAIESHIKNLHSGCFDAKSPGHASQASSPKIYSETSSNFIHDLVSTVDRSTSSPLEGAVPFGVNLLENNTFKCPECGKCFLDISAVESHLFSDHNMKPQLLQLSANNSLLYQLVPAASNLNSTLAPPKEDSQTDSKKPVSNISMSKRKLLPKSIEREIPPKRVGNKKSNTNDSKTANSDKNVSTYKKAAKRKMLSELGTYICEHKGCNVRFRALDNLEYHYKCHSVVGIGFSCAECGALFDKWSIMAGHLWRTHRNDMELKKCDKCPFRTYSMSRLENYHKRIHKEESLFLCDKCGKSYKNSKQLRNHKERCERPQVPRNNANVLPTFRCILCPSQFPSKLQLKYHKDAMHNIKHKNYMCNICDYSTHKGADLRMHLRKHTGEKPFACDKCDYRTIDHNSLRRHKMIHSGEKKYKCPQCSYSSIHAFNFKTHLTKKHPDQNGIVFSCNVCSFQTLKIQSYLLHSKEHESSNVLPNVSQMNCSDETFPFAEAMGISFSNGDSQMLYSQFDKNKNIQSFLNNFDINLGSVGLGNGT